MAAGRKIGVRNPYSTRPYQHVLEPLAAYLLIAQRQYEDSRFAGYYNVGPDDCDCVTTGTLVDLFCRAWGGDAAWENQAEANAPHEANFLKLDCSKLKRPSAGRRAGTWPSAWKRPSPSARSGLPTATSRRRWKRKSIFFGGAIIMWKNEAEAREQIKAMVTEYYHDFKEKKGPYQRVIASPTQPASLTRRRCVL